MNWEFLSSTFAPYVALALVAFLPSEIWRVLAVALSRGLNEDSEIIIWVRAVATALLTGVVASIVIGPSGALALVPLWARIGALGVGLAAHLLLRRSVLASIIFGEAAIIAAAWHYGL